MKKGANIGREVTVYELSHQAEDVNSFHLIRLPGDFLDQLGFTRDGSITIYQEGNKLVILREAVHEENKDRRET